MLEIRTRLSRDRLSREQQLSWGGWRGGSARAAKAAADAAYAYNDAPQRQHTSAYAGGGQQAAWDQFHGRPWTYDCPPVQAQPYYADDAYARRLNVTLSPPMPYRQQAPQAFRVHLFFQKLL